MAVGTVSGAWVEELLLAIDVDDGKVIIKLPEAEIAFQKNVAISIGDTNDICLHARGSGHGNEEFGQLIVAAAFARQDVIGGVNLLQTVGPLLRSGVFAGIVGVLKPHNGSVELAEFLVLRVCGTGEIFDCGTDPRSGTDEFITRLRPEFALVLPEL